MLSHLLSQRADLFNVHYKSNNCSTYIIPVSYCSSLSMQTSRQAYLCATRVKLEGVRGTDSHHYDP